MQRLSFSALALLTEVFLSSNAAFCQSVVDSYPPEAITVQTQEVIPTTKVVDGVPVGTSLVVPADVTATGNVVVPTNPVVVMDGGAAPVAVPTKKVVRTVVQ